MRRRPAASPGAAAEDCELSVVIPAYNEQAHLTRHLPKILDALGGRFRRFEVLVVDDGSRDGTALVGAPWGPHGVRTLSLDRNRGKGAAVRRGVSASRGRAVLVTDADLSTPIEELDHLLSFLPEAPLVVASRAVETSSLERAQPAVRRLLGLLFGQLVRTAAQALQQLLQMLHPGAEHFGLAVLRGGFAVERVPL
ncbi:MAG: glycosyltransferase, partial [Acidobacteriota bacterium]